MAELDPDTQLAPPAESIHMPDPSYLPFALTIGITIFLLGLITWLPILIIGAIIVIWVLFLWIRSARAEMSELPLEH